MEKIVSKTNARVKKWAKYKEKKYRDSDRCFLVEGEHLDVYKRQVVDGVHVLNPGSLWRSRDGRGPSYAVVELEGDNVDVEFKFLPQSKSNFFW